MLTKINFLIVEDEEDLSDLYEDSIRDWCSAQGIVPFIIKATDGIQATQKYFNQDFHVLVVDINMPKKNGIEFLKSSKDLIISKRTNVIIVSGSLTKNHLVEAMGIGVTDILVKPFVGGDFKQLLDKFKYD